MREELRVIGFAALVCVVCSLVLSVAYSSLYELQMANVVLDQKFNVLKALGVDVVDAKGKKTMTAEQITTFFDENIEGYVLDKSGDVIEDLAPSALTDAEVASASKSRYPVFVYTDPASGSKNVAMHISGKGLWSTLKGYLALGPDLETIAGITFYEHKETPGLGGEVDKPWFQKNFNGKQLFDGDRQLPFEIVKGKVSEVAPQKAAYAVDGIPGATMTTKGMNKFLKADMAVYNQHLTNLRAQ